MHQVLDEHRLQLKNLAPASKCLRAVIIHQDETMFKGFCTFNSSSLDPSLSCASVHVFNHSLSHTQDIHSLHLGPFTSYAPVSMHAPGRMSKTKSIFITLATHVDTHTHKPTYTAKTSSHHRSDSVLSKSCSKRSSTKYHVWLMSHFKLE